MLQEIKYTIFLHFLYFPEIIGWIHGKRNITFTHVFEVCTSCLHSQFAELNKVYILNFYKSGIVAHLNTKSRFRHFCLLEFRTDPRDGEIGICFDLKINIQSQFVVVSLKVWLRFKQRSKYNNLSQRPFIITSSIVFLWRFFFLFSFSFSCFPFHSPREKRAYRP